MRTLTDSAVALHELFLTLQQAGFSEAHALYLAGQVLSAKVRAGDLPDAPGGAGGG